MPASDQRDTARTSTSCNEYIVASLGCTRAPSSDRRTMLRLLAASTAMLCGHAVLGGAGSRAYASQAQRSLPKAYTVLSEKIIKSLRDSFEAEAEGASESEVSALLGEGLVGSVPLRVRSVPELRMHACMDGGLARSLN